MRKLKNILQHSYIYILCLIITIIFSYYKIDTYNTKYNINDSKFRVKIIDYKIKKNNLSIIGLGKEKIIINHNVKSTFERDQTLKYIKFGNYIDVWGQIDTPKENIKEDFNYKKYLNQQNIYWIVNSKIITLNKETSNLFYKIKNLIYKRTKRIKNNKYIYSFILGNSNYIEEEVLKNYRDIGISHLFALSGLHVNIFALLLFTLFKRFNIYIKLQYLLVFLILLLFAFITGFSPSILRSVLFFFMLFLNKITNINLKTEDVLILVCIFMLIINPTYMYMTGFLLSFICTYFLIISSYLLENKSYFIKSLLISSIATYSTLPIIININNKINLMSVLYNIVFVPYVSYILFPITIIVFLFPKLNFMLLFLSKLMEKLTYFLSMFNTYFFLPKFNALNLIIYYTLLFISLKYKKIKILYIIIIYILIIKFINI